VAGYHTVAQGEHLSSIAHSLGFSDYETIWNHPNNSSLKSQRQNPNVLFPGDQLYIPDLEHKDYSRPTDQQHKFVAKKPTLKLRLTLEDQYEKPIANAACSITVDGDTRQATSDGTGKVELPIPPSAQCAVLVIQDNQQTPYGGITIPIKIGHLDPVDQVTGQQGRLNGLGYFSGDIDGNPNPDFESAVEEFQCDQGLTVDGICGPVTQAKLKQVYGC